MGKKRSLKAQLKFAVQKCQRFGQSKHADKKNPEIYTKEGVYSISSSDALKDTVTNFANFMSEKHPEIGYVRDITVDHINEWIAYRQADWSNKTYDNMVSRIGKMELLLNKTYHLELDLTTGLMHRPKDRQDKEEIRNKAMSRDDLRDLITYMKNSTSPNGWIALEITSRCGLRVKEVSCLRFSNIDTDNKVIHVVEGAKNGRKRDVAIRDKDILFFRKFCREYGNQEYVTGGIKEDSINKSIRRAMQAIGIDLKYKETTEHAVRKLYASERYQEELKKTNDKKKAFTAVQHDLGHGDFRTKLFDTYVYL